GGLTEALLMVDAARAAGLPLMVGCMVGTSLAMAPAILPAQAASFTDLDGPLLLARDRDHTLEYSHGCVHPPKFELWG
ncbi:MAG: dipeptide epimerase, partial [Rhodobacteraceae bacterium]|nr:dipeptide epimerase [Paracoccaceae bacterium]